MQEAPFNRTTPNLPLTSNHYALAFDQIVASSSLLFYASQSARGEILSRCQLSVADFDFKRTARFLSRLFKALPDCQLPTVMNIQIPCPNCSAQPIQEFVYGEIPVAPETLTAADARDLDREFMRNNVEGVSAERWFHAYSCRRWLALQRNTGNDQIQAE